MRLRAAQDMVEMIWSCGHGTTTVQGWVLERKVQELFRGFESLAYSPSTGEVALERRFNEDGTAWGLEHWVSQRALDFKGDFVQLLAAVGCDHLPDTTKAQLKLWAMDVYACVKDS